VSVFTEARRLHDLALVDHDDTVARLVHGIILGMNPVGMVAGAIHDGYLTRKQGEQALASARLFLANHPHQVAGAVVA
jgi:hypothetical protein